MAAVVRAGQTSVGFWLLSCTFVFQSAAVVGGRFSNPMPAQSPVRKAQARLISQWLFSICSLTALNF